MEAIADVNELYEFALRQMAAESYLEGVNLSIARDVKEILKKVLIEKDIRMRRMS